MFQTALNALKPNTAVLGYALFLAVNATGVWGGVFPFLPMKIQTTEVMFQFYLAQSLMMFAVFFALARASYCKVRLKPSACVLLASTIYFGGWAFLIASMYLHQKSLALAVAGGVFLGCGSAMFYLLWQRVFASRNSDNGMRDLIAGFAYAALFYFALYLIPRAVTAYLIPLVFLPLFALAVILGSRRINFSQPMFSDAPRENMRVYRRAVSSLWRSALCMGAIAFCAGLVRSIAIEQPVIGSLVNLLSMGAMLVASLAVLFLWKTKGLKLNLIKLYRIVFPLIISAFVVLPFTHFGYIRWLAAGLFALYSIGLMLTMMQCAQISRDRGVNPFFAFGLFGGIVYGLHDVGFISGALIGWMPGGELAPNVLTALVAIYLLALMFFVGSVNFKNSAAQLLYGDTIELVAPVMEGAPAPEADAKPRDDDTAPGDAADLLSLQVGRLKDHYHLSEREAEVVDLVVHGNTVARIAEQLFISENTVRTHTKRIYTKLDVHKKQELIDLVAQF